MRANKIGLEPSLFSIKVKEPALMMPTSGEKMRERMVGRAGHIPPASAYMSYA